MNIIKLIVLSCVLFGCEVAQTPLPPHIFHPGDKVRIKNLNVHCVVTKIVGRYDGPYYYIMYVDNYGKMQSMMTHEDLLESENAYSTNLE